MIVNRESTKEFSEVILKELSRLSYYSRLLRVVGLYVVTAILCEIGFFFFFSVGRFPFAPTEFSLMIIATLSFMNLLLLFFHDSARRQGEIIYQELSDELHWGKSTITNAMKREDSENRPSLEARLILRAFDQSTELPMVPGRSGPSVYAAISIALPIALALIERLHAM